MNYLKYLILLLSISTYSQNTIISGTVYDGTTKEPIAFATIYLPQLEKGTTTDDNGIFHLSNIPDGVFKLVVSFIGYETVSKEINTNAPGNLILNLNPSAIEMEQVIVSTPFHQLQRDNVMKVEQQSLKDLKNLGAVTLAEGITNIAGVESITTGSAIGKPVIRGLSANRVLVYAQGIRLENQQFGDEHGLGISDSGIESVEVIKGPASLLYGSDALGGVLYLNPERFAGENTSKSDIAATAFSNTQGFSTNAGYKSSGEHAKFLVRASSAEYSDYKTKAFRVTNSRSKELDFKTGIGYQMSNFNLDLRYNYNLANVGIPEEIGEQTTTKTPQLPSQRINTHLVSLKNKLFFKNSSLESKFGYTFNNRKEFEDEDGSQITALEMHLSTLSYDVKYNLPKWGKLETIIGAQGMFQRNTNFGEEALIPDAEVKDIGVLATSHLHLNEANDLQMGLRFDTRNITTEERGVVDEEGYFAPINKSFSSFNAALGYKTDFTKSMTARLNIASGFRAPNLGELTSNGVHEGTNRYEIGNSNLKNEQNYQLDLALEYKIEHLELFLNGFLNKVNNYIFISPGDDIIQENPVFNYLQEDAKLYGGEIGFHLHPHPLDWLHLETIFETVTGEQDSGAYLPLIPANKLTNTLRVELNEQKWLESGYVFLKLKSAFDQNKVSDFETNTKGYNLLSFGFGGRIPVNKNKLSINLSLTNLTNTTYIDHLSRLKIDGIPNMGRSYNFGLTFEM